VVNPETPCVYESRGEPYELLASPFYAGALANVTTALKAVNIIDCDKPLHASGLTLRVRVGHPRTNYLV